MAIEQKTAPASDDYAWGRVRDRVETDGIYALVTGITLAELLRRPEVTYGGRRL